MNTKVESNLKKLLKTKGFKKNFPFLYQIITEEMLVDGTTYRYDSWGFCRELTDEQKDKVAELEKKWEKYNLKVLFVLESVMQDPCGDKFEMDNYVYITDEDISLGIDLDPQSGVWRPIAQVHNKTWDETESGYVLVKEVVGTMRRIG